MKGLLHPNLYTVVCASAKLNIVRVEFTILADSKIEATEMVKALYSGLTPMKVYKALESEYDYRKRNHSPS